MRWTRVADIASEHGNYNALVGHPRNSVVMKPLIITFVSLLMPIQAVLAQEQPFRFTVSGPLAEKLASDTQIRLWYPSSDTSDWATFELADLPASLPFQRSEGHGWYATFVSPKSGGSFSVTLSRDLFDRPRTVNIVLDAPSPHIRPIFGILGDVRYTAGITKRMGYADMPRWDNKLDELSKPKPPVMQITSRQRGGGCLQR